MKITNELIIECAKSKGFRIPDKPFKYFGMTISVSDKDIQVARAKTANFVGNEDLGEWWVSYYGGRTQFRVTDEDMKQFIRDRKIKELLD